MNKIVRKFRILPSLILTFTLNIACTDGASVSSISELESTPVSFSSLKLDSSGFASLEMSTILESIDEIDSGAELSKASVEEHCSDDSLSVVISVADLDSENFSVLSNYNKSCKNKINHELSLVVDNSASAEDHLDFIKSSSKKLVDDVVNGGGKTSLTRISTNSSIRNLMSDDKDELHNSIDALWSSNGYTAMYDAMRMGFSTMNMIEPTYVDNGRLDQFCDNRSRKAMVLFSDGGENNSLDDYKEKYDFIKYPGDGIDTKIEDIIGLSEKLQSPIYTIGLGDDHDAEAMKLIAEKTGGIYISGQTREEIPSLFEKIGTFLKGSTSLCFDVRKLSCGTKKLKVQYNYNAEEQNGIFASNRKFEEKIFELDIPCDTNTPTVTPDVISNRCKNHDENILKNPSFETNNVYTSRRRAYIGMANRKVINDIDRSGEWDIYRYLPASRRGDVAWYTSGGFGIELQNTGTVTNSFEGTKHVELDSGNSNSNSSMSQNVYMCAGVYDLKARYYARTPDIDDNNIEVYLGKTKIGVLQHELDGVWHLLDIPVVIPKDSIYLLTFKGGGKQNSLGGLLDDVSLTRK